MVNNGPGLSPRFKVTDQRPTAFQFFKKKNQIQRLALNPQLFQKIERTCGFHERTY
jgi:hypothetical protein